ncbi:MAG: hypothetical protein VB141_13820, partial [Burkholderia gladioli]
MLKAHRAIERFATADLAPCRSASRTMCRGNIIQTYNSSFRARRKFHPSLLILLNSEADSPR